MFFFFYYKQNVCYRKIGHALETNETNLSFDNLLKKGNSVSLHQKNLQILATEIYKMRNDLGPETMKDIFHFVHKPCNLRNDSNSAKPNNVTGSISSLASKIWLLVPCEMKNVKSLDISFKKNKTHWQQINVLVDFVKGTLTM